MVFHFYRHHCPDDSLLLPGNRRVGDSTHHPIGHLDHAGRYSHSDARGRHRDLAFSRDAGADPDATGVAHDYEYADTRSHGHRNEHEHAHRYSHGHADDHSYSDRDLYAGTHGDPYAAAHSDFYATSDGNLHSLAARHADANA